MKKSKWINNLAKIVLEKFRGDLKEIITLSEKGRVIAYSMDKLVGFHFDYVREIKWKE